MEWFEEQKRIQRSVEADMEEHAALKLYDMFGEDLMSSDKEVPTISLHQPETLPCSICGKILEKTGYDWYCHVDRVRFTRSARGNVYLWKRGKKKKVN